MSKEDNKNNFDLITPADAVDYDPLKSKNIVSENNSKDIFEIIISKFQNIATYSDDKSCLFINDVTKWNQVADYLLNNKHLKLDYLMCLSGYDLTDKRLGVAYNFYSTKLKHYLEVRIEVEEEVEIPSVSHIWKTANWHEREAFDLVGLKFTNHPDMKRILLPKDWEGHPLRKDYETPDFYNGMPVPKDKSYWE